MQIALPFGLIVRFVVDLYRGMSVRERVALLVTVLAGIAVGSYGYLSSHDVVSSVFLGLAGFTLAMVSALLLRAARALVEEPAEVDAAQVTGRRKKELEREKAALLKALKELEFDHEMGKISDPDFREIGGQYRARAMRVLRQLDEAGADYKSLVEKELKLRLGVKTAAPAPGEKLPDEKATDYTCEDCGTKNDADAVFCKKCGKKVAA